MTDDLTAPHPGDKVRLIKEGVVVDVKVDGECTVVLIGGYRYTLRDKRYAVEILERADDPSRDLVGTIAELKSEVWVKTGRIWWTQIGDSRDRSNGDMADRRVTGAIPGTPAATAQEVEAQQRLLRPEWRSKPNPGPLVVQYGDPEPDEGKKFQAVHRDVVWTRRDGTWLAPGIGAHFWPRADVDHVNCSCIPASDFPLTEMIEP